MALRARINDSSVATGLVVVVVAVPASQSRTGASVANAGVGPSSVTVRLRIRGGDPAGRRRDDPVGVSDDADGDPRAPEELDADRDDEHAGERG